MFWNWLNGSIGMLAARKIQRKSKWYPPCASPQPGCSKYSDIWIFFNFSNTLSYHIWWLLGDYWWLLPKKCVEHNKPLSSWDAWFPQKIQNTSMLCCFTQIANIGKDRGNKTGDLESGEAWKSDSAWSPIPYLTNDADVIWVGYWIHNVHITYILCSP